MPPEVVNIARRRFARLKVTSDYKIERRKAIWRCVCDCGRVTWVRGTSLRAGRIVSCGCARRDPAIRQAARWKLSPARRAAIARMGGRARR